MNIEKVLILYSQSQSSQSQSC